MAVRQPSTILTRKLLTGTRYATTKRSVTQGEHLRTWKVSDTEDLQSAQEDAGSQSQLHGRFVTTNVPSLRTCICNVLGSADDFEMISLVASGSASPCN